MSTRGIFSLGTIETRIREDSWVPMPTVWGGDTRYDGVEKINYNMYFTGGNGNPGGSLPERTSYADKIVITTDTSSVVPSAQLPFNVGMTDDGFNTPSTTVSWWAGNQRSRVYKLTYATESQSSSPSGTFANGPGGDNEWTQKSAVGNNESGYFGGGDQSNATSVVQKIVFSEETFANLPSTANLPGNRTRAATVGTDTRGYWYGGYPNTQNASRMEYSTDTMTQISNGQESYFSRGSTGTDIAGYFTGGSGSPHNGFTGGETGTEKLVYSTETFTPVPTLYSNYMYGLSSYWGNGSRRGVGGSGSKEYGYWAGGLYPAPGTPNDYRSWVDKIDFATETASRRITNIQNPRAIGQMGTGPRKNALATYDPPIPTPTATQTVTPASPQTQNIGYAAAGSGAAGGTTVDKMTLSNGTIARIPSTISPSPGPSLRVGSVGYGSKTHAFVAGGAAGPSYMMSIIDKIEYSTDTVNLNSLQIPSSPNGQWDGKSSQTKTTGYFFGMASGPTDYTHKHPFATDTLTRFENWSTPSPMPTSYPGSRTRGSSTFNDLPQTNIYAMGSYNGSYGSYYSARLKPATDTWDNGTPSPAWGRSDYQARRDGANGGAASTTKGYVGGGGYNLSNVPGNLSVFEFSTETWDYLPSGPPNTSYYYFGKGIIGNQTESYWLGGSPGPSWPSWSVTAGDGSYKYTYATDTWSNNWEGGMPAGRSRFATMSPRMFQNDVYIPQDNLL